MFGRKPFGVGRFGPDDGTAQLNKPVEQPVCDWATLERLIKKKKPRKVALRITGATKVSQKPARCKAKGAWREDEEEIAMVLLEVLRQLDIDELQEAKRAAETQLANFDADEEAAEAIELVLRAIQEDDQREARKAAIAAQIASLEGQLQALNGQAITIDH